MTQICITGNESSVDALEERLEHVFAAHPDLIAEVRLDKLGLSPQQAFQFLAKLPVEWARRLVVTQRLRASGLLARGGCDWDVLTWQSWWRDVLPLKPWFACDLDWLLIDRLAAESLSWQIPQKSGRLFFSLHADLDELPTLLPEFIASARRYGGGLKIACPVGGALDLCRLAAAADEIERENLPLKTAVAMGDAGKAWRWSNLAGDISYFASDSTQRTAQGQDTLADVLPYLKKREAPRLYLLWSRDPRNTHGEKRWNRVFRARGLNARYVNIPCFDPDLETETEKREWAVAALAWMRRAGVAGASVTRPFKEWFPLAIPGENPAINTLRAEAGGKWSTHNTDGTAVSRILAEYGAAAGPVLIAGGGGAARAVGEELRKQGLRAELWVRNAEGDLPSLGDIAPAALVCTWPGEFQEKLAAELRRHFTNRALPRLLIDAQFSVPEVESPVAAWCREEGVPYIPGARWWSYQAQQQDRIWFPEAEARWGEAVTRLQALLPRSKSETIRALALAACRTGKTTIRRPSICRDTEVMREAVEALGVEVMETAGAWVLRPPRQLEAPKKAIFVDECATALRFLLALSTRVKGEQLLLDAAPSLRARPLADAFQALGWQPSGNTWPLAVPCGLALPQTVNVGTSSQFASGFLIAGASSGKAGALRWEGEMKSRPYLELTANFLQESGLPLYLTAQGAAWEAGETRAAWETEIGWDASNASYLEILARASGLPSIYTEGSRQGDAIFPAWLQELAASDSASFSLRDHPDLAPSLWAAALLQGRGLEVHSAPHLRAKESDRALALVEAARALGIEAEVRADGFRIAPGGISDPRARLDARGDHRLAMAFGLLWSRYPQLEIHGKEAVAKSFPNFWEAVECLRELIP